MIEAVIFDWAGTTVDYGCFAPVQAFVEAFAHHGVAVTMEETRKPMGMLKRDHIRTMLGMERIAKEWERVHGRKPCDTDVDAVYAQFEPKLFSILDQYAAPKPFAVETAARLREMGLKIGSTTGYTDAMMNIVVPQAEKQGYAPDFWISPDGVDGKGRPYPYMIFANMKALGVSAVKNVVKVGDTISDIKEGVNAASGRWALWKAVPSWGSVRASMRH
ncbi:phosphonoacetaldehyde hydrolase [uncultured Allofournierella sp.]|uniref:phosphonoacetaldehyde hydrolase n=1 Tax=uncultured Allofournierella sp. TaxID=1940258 RepID=UPI003459174F